MRAAVADSLAGLDRVSVLHHATSPKQKGGVAREIVRHCAPSVECRRRQTLILGRAHVAQPDRTVPRTHVRHKAVVAKNKKKPKGLDKMSDITEDDSLRKRHVGVGRERADSSDEVGGRGHDEQSTAARMARRQQRRYA